MTRRALLVSVLVTFALFTPSLLQASDAVADMVFCRTWLQRLEEDLGAFWKLLHPQGELHASLGDDDQLSDGVLTFKKTWRQSHWRLAEQHRRSFEVYMFAIGDLLKTWRKRFEDEAARKNFETCYKLIDDLRGNLKSDWFKPEDEHRATALAKLRNKMIPDLRNNARAACEALTRAIASIEKGKLVSYGSEGLPGEDLPGESLDDSYDTLPSSNE